MRNETSGDLISRSALHKILEEEQDGTRRIYSSLVDYRDKEVCKGELGTYARVKRMVEEAPTIDPESLRPMGRWFEIIETKEDGYTGEYYEDVYYNCINCDYASDWNSPYCPNCGTKMMEV